MLTKYKKRIMDLLSNYTPVKNMKASKLVIFGAFGLVMVVVSLYLAGWCYNSYAKENANLKDLEALLIILVSPQNVAFVSFASVYLVDADGDGVPDAAKNRAKEG